MSIQRYRLLNGDDKIGVYRSHTDEDGIAVLHSDHVAAVCELIERIAELEKRVADLKDQLRDSNTVHINILRGTIALKKSQAIHIAGLPADIEEQLAAASKRIEELSAPVSAEEWEKFGFENYFLKVGVNNLIAARKGK